MKKTFIVLIAATIIFSVAGISFSEEIDLSSCKSDTIVKAPGGSFAQIFTGQTLAGPEILGLPSNPLTLSPVGDLYIQTLGKITTVSSETTYTGPLSVLLDSDATSLSFNMGHGQPPSTLKIDFFAADGSLVHSVTQEIYKDYNTYSFKGFGTFRGFSIHKINDPAGLRFHSFKYNCI
ncbi:MAG: hypothetical protein HY807_00655 [Nitrospirae bacterium]|nr:hypothetical protein [Nitrospirota bacterium]